MIDEALTGFHLPATCIALSMGSTPSALGVFAEHFEQQVALSPDSLAIEFENTRWSYEKVNSSANQVARFLIQQNYVRETCIGVCMDRSAEAIVTMLGILKAGCAFVPLDPEFPKDRLAFIVEDASIQTIFSDPNYRSLFEANESRAIYFANVEDAAIQALDTSNLDLLIPADSLAYVMYTSGSTGKPKGVQIEHRSLMTYCAADIEIYDLKATDRTLQFSTLNFDIAIEEIFPPLLVGSAVIVRPRERAESHNELSHLVSSLDITALHIATAYWNEWVDLLVASQAWVPESLRLVIATGEKISVEHYRRWKSLCRQPIRWCNAYGPTETTVTCTAFIPDADWDDTQMPIGKPLPGYSAFILDENLQPVPSNETGHLFIGGPGLARGYLNRPELNAKAFFEVTWDSSRPAERLYRTGDLARWLPTGDIEFSGRVDHQMKIGSYRIEPGEIEAVLARLSSVRESLVVGTEKDSEKFLVAYVVANEPLSSKAISSFLREHLPSYMVPAHYVFLESLPKTINGKIDRKALPAPEWDSTTQREGESEAANELERELLEIWSQVLKIRHIGRDDDFFLLGGSSLLVTRVIAKMAGRLKKAIPVRDFFANPTVASLCRHLAATDSADLSQNGSIGHLQTSQDDLRRSRNRLPTIQPQYIEVDGERLASVLYPAVGPSQRQNHTVVICNAYGHEHTRAFRNLQQLSLLLAQEGFDCLRFDFSATGNSTGTDRTTSLTKWIREVEVVTEFARQQSKNGAIQNKLSLIGVRLGASIASQATITGLEHLILWDPILDGRAYLNHLKTFHDFELKSLTRYLTRRSSSSNAYLGHHFSEELTADLRDLNLARSVQATARASWVLTSRSSQLRSEPPLEIASWRTLQVDDAIFWNDREYTQSAFSSPLVFQKIRSIVKGECE